MAHSASRKDPSPEPPVHGERFSLHHRPLPPDDEVRRRGGVGAFSQGPTEVHNLHVVHGAAHGAADHHQLVGIYVVGKLLRRSWVKLGLVMLINCPL